MIGTNTEKTLQWLKTAEIDLNSAKLLFSQKQYSTAVYHTQQTYEKILKAYCSFLGFQDEQIRRLGHLEPNEKRYSEFIRSANEQTRESLTKLGLGKFAEAIDKVVKASPDAYQSALALPIELIRNQETTIPEMKNFVKAHEAALEKTDFFGKESIVLTFMGILIILPSISAHFKFVRYPDSEIKPYDYSDQTGIVQVIPDLLSVAEYCIKKLRTTLV